MISLFTHGILTLQFYFWRGKFDEKAACRFGVLDDGVVAVFL